MNNTIALKSNNRGQIVGRLVSIDGKFDVEGENFYEGKLEVERLSETVDILPFTISEKLIKAYNLDLKAGTELALGGELRSYNRVIDGKSRLILSFFVKDVLSPENLPDGNTNTLKLVGYICKEPIFRVTPFNRQICDVLIAVNRPNFNKSDYLPCIFWGRNACFMQNEISGMVLPQELVEAYRGLDREQASALAVQTALETGKRIFDLVDGYYLVTPFGRVELVSAIMEGLRGGQVEERE